MNKLYYGDCLTVMRELPVNSIDLIYLDPPFNSNRSYNAIYKDETGRPLPVQIEAFCDTWELTEERERAIRNMPVLMGENGIDDDTVEFLRLWMHALRNTQPRLLAYLSYMVERLLVMYRLMKPTASLYLHCDPTASHYLKALLDALFGHQNFRNEIIWLRRAEKHNLARKHMGRIHDTILWYVRSDGAKYRTLFFPYDEAYIKANYKHQDGRGRYATFPCTNEAGGNKPYAFRGITRAWRFSPEGMQKLFDDDRLAQPKPGSPWRYKKYLDEAAGVPAQDVWTDVSPARRKESLGYATQKPLALLERIIKASSDPGETVLDPFCGCATTLEAAQRLGRNWIGIDIAIHAIKRAAQVRLTERCGLTEGQDFVVEGIPKTLEGARDVWERDPYQFQKWAVEQVEGFATQKRSADGGIDGRIYFDMPGKRDLQSMVVEVKGGKNVAMQALRALRGVLDSGDAQMAGLIVMEPLGDRQHRNFIQFMAQAGDLEINGFPYPRMQMLSVKEILAGKRFHLPNIAGRHELQPRLVPTQPGA